MSAKLSLSSTVKLNSGFELPLLGFGAYQVPKEQAMDMFKEALRVGYRHIDSASAYRNQGHCGAAMVASGLRRSEVFFTTKIPMQQYPLGYESTHRLVDMALAETALGYLDLVLIHAPYGGPRGRKGAWRALVECVEAGKVRSLGVSNYGLHHLEELEAYMHELAAERGGGAHKEGRSAVRRSVGGASVAGARQHRALVSRPQRRHRGLLSHRPRRALRRRPRLFAGREVRQDRGPDSLALELAARLRAPRQERDARPHRRERGPVRL